jgi:Domain of unknown function (DUF4397)
MRVVNSLRIFAAGAAMAAALGLGGCGGGSTSPLDGDVRLVNATSEFATMDLYDGSSNISAGIPSYGVGGYVGVKADAHTFNIADGGTGVISASVNGVVTKRDHFTIVAYASGGTLNATYLPDDAPAPSSGSAKLRFFNTASTDVTPIDAYLVTTACANLSSSLSAPIATAVSGLQTLYTQVNASGSGTAYHICVTAAGDKTDLRLDIPAATLKDGEIATLILTPSPGGVLLNGLLLDQQGSLTTELNTTARIRLAVGAANSAPVTATVNGVSLATGLSAPAVSNYMLVPAGPLTIDLSVGGAPANATGLSAMPGDDLTLLVTGTATSTPVLIVDDNSLSNSSANPVKIRLVNGMNGLTGTAILTDDFNNVGNGATFGTATAYAQVPASSALAQLEVTSGPTQLCLSTLVTLNANSVYSVFLLGDIPPTPGACTIRVDR